jgi:hypothetical protein
MDLFPFFGKNENTHWQFTSSFRYDSLNSPKADSSLSQQALAAFPLAIFFDTPNPKNAGSLESLEVT